MRLRAFTYAMSALAIAITLASCAGLPGGATGLDPKFMEGVNSLLTSTNCGHHDEFRATVGAAGIPASTSVVLVRDCPTPPAAGASSNGAPPPAPPAP